MLQGMERVLSALDLTTLQTRLTEAGEALHQLAMGKAQVTIKFSDSVGGQEVTYNAASLPKLQTYMQQLQSAIDLKQGGLGRRAIHPVAG